MEVPGKKRKCISSIRKFGEDVLHDLQINKGLAFSLEERQLLGLLDILPDRVMTQTEQIEEVIHRLDSRTSDLDKYDYIMSVLTENEKLFYRTLETHVEKLMPIVYTPVVGAACQNFSRVYRPGLHVGHLDTLFEGRKDEDIRAIVVTDGERILGLGDLGVFGMGIPIGKLALYSVCAGVHPKNCLPITLDVGTNNEELLRDPNYFGLRQKRVTGERYDSFVEEFMYSVVKRFGPDTLIQYEDFGNSNAFRLLEKYREKFLTFNDDIQGTGAVGVAGLIAATRMMNESSLVKGTKISIETLSKQKYLFLGAGEAALGIAELLVEAMEQEGTSKDEAIKRIYLVDSKGLVIKNRPAGGLTPLKEVFAHDLPPVNTLEEAVTSIKPSALIGLSAQGGAFTESILKKMAEYNERPVVFALSNPTHKAECTAEQAYRGKAIYASGSPFDPVEFDGKQLIPGQGNNAYIFPGISLAVILFKLKNIPSSVFLKAAQILASTVTVQDLEKGLIYPPLSNIREVCVQLAIKLGEFFYTPLPPPDVRILATVPRPENIEEFVRSQLYDSTYETYYLPTWPLVPQPVEPQPSST